jgi:hypothetical protein
MDPVEEFLEHHGIKGQKWGIRNKKKSSEEKHPWSKKKKTTVILGSAVAVAAITAGAIYAKKHYGVPVSGLPKSLEGAKFTEAMVKEPTDIIHATRGKHRGFGILRHGGINNPVAEMDKAFGGNESAGYFKRYGDHLEKVAGSFPDPQGRKDFAGRTIPHVVILPKGMSEGVNNIDDLQKKAWPLIKDTFNALHGSAFDARK